MIPRVIPTLLLDQGGLVKTVRFRDPRYVGDPINTVRIFNDKQVDEIVLLDIGATREARGPDEAAIEEIAGEAFMPVGYGGGVSDLATATRMIQLGVEKVIVNTAAIETPGLVREIADHLGSSTIVVSLDVARRPDGSPEVRSHGGTRSTGLDARAHAEAMAVAGAGELIVQSIDRDGTMAGYEWSSFARLPRPWRSRSSPAVVPGRSTMSSQRSARGAHRPPRPAACSSSTASTARCS